MEKNYRDYYQLIWVDGRAPGSISGECERDCDVRFSSVLASEGHSPFLLPHFYLGQQISSISSR